ncbi:pentatricopeptide repeat-containing protein At2g33680-like [Selaginella moellendorffii]|uniref:pentatricopeptide repeat-containing protein At2g33680-like n=1 Tax=Selaginella moellendorffii TaxID=88036 RepID=UPI000D1C5C58|nr:pentatricopeptide repeat-containing protein At2g33680-like [Selaginella moellendorffii]|eukprot:XP_024516885.1 pentatricopeptide repeat-containing protein At2g33680-like [Selaginella moellendorffii]
MAVETASLSAAAAVRLLHQCSARRDLALGRSIHQMLLAKNRQQESGLSPLVANTLIDMYAKCGSVEEARCVLESMGSSGSTIPDVVSWTSLIWGYSQRGQWDQAMALLGRMQQEGVAPNSFTFGSILKACKDVEAGARIHRFLLQVRHGQILYHDVYVATALVGMYGSCGHSAAAREVFDAIPSATKNIVTWSAMLGTYASAATGDHPGGDQSLPSSFPSSCSNASVWRQQGMELFWSFLNDGSLRVDKVVFITVLGLCSNLTQGCFCHSCALEAGFAADPAVCHALIVTYGRCGSSPLARQVFSEMVRKDVVSWTSMIKAADADECLLLFRQMLLEGVAPNELTLAEALHSCSLAPDLPATFAVGQCVHACARELGYETDVVVGTSLINMYAKCAALPQAEAIFHLLATNARTNCVCWTAMITANAKAGEWKQAIRLYRQMQLQGIAPNRVSFVAALSACSTPEFLATGELVHSCTVERGLESDTMVANAVVSMYGKCGSVEDARKMFDGMKRRDSVTWSAMLAAIALAGELDSRARNEQALLLFARMQLEGVKPTKDDPFPRASRSPARRRRAGGCAVERRR